MSDIPTYLLTAGLNLKKYITPDSDIIMRYFDLYLLAMGKLLYCQTVNKLHKDVCRYWSSA